MTDFIEGQLLQEQVGHLFFVSGNRTGGHVVCGSCYLSSSACCIASLFWSTSHQLNPLFHYLGTLEHMTAYLPGNTLLMHVWVARGHLSEPTKEIHQGSVASLPVHLHPPHSIIKLPGTVSCSQVESVKKVSEFVSQLRRVGKGLGVYQFDKQLAEETA